MPDYNDKISMTDSGWQHITLSAKNPNGVNVRYSPLILENNIAGRVLHESAGIVTKGLANLKHTYNSGVYAWLPVQLVGKGFEGQPYLWIASNLINYELGDFVLQTNEPLFYDLSLPGQPTIHILPEQLAIVVEVLRSVANYLAAKEGIL